MWVSILCEFGLKCLLTPLFGGFGAHFSQMMSLIVLTPKRTVLGLNYVIWATNREKSVARFELGVWTRKKDRTGKKQKGYISPICGEAPIEAMYIKICLVGDVTAYYFTSAPSWTRITVAGGHKGYKQQKWPSRSLKVTRIGAIRWAACDFLLVFNCNCVYLAPMPRYYHLFPKIQIGHVTLTHPFLG